jgi:hypothetical protein
MMEGTPNQAGVPDGMNLAIRLGRGEDEVPDGGITQRRTVPASFRQRRTRHREVRMIDLDRVRAETPGTAHGAYLHNAGTGLMPAPVLTAMSSTSILKPRSGLCRRRLRARAAGSGLRFDRDAPQRDPR